MGTQLGLAGNPQKNIVAARSRLGRSTYGADTARRTGTGGSGSPGTTEELICQGAHHRRGVPNALGVDSAGQVGGEAGDGSVGTQFGQDVPIGTRTAPERCAILKWKCPRGKIVETRILVAHDDEYSAYREVIAAGVRVLRPHAVVATCTPHELGGELERFDPQVVVCGRPGIADPGDRPAWVELPTNPERPAKVRIGTRRRESPYLLLEGLLAVIDEAERLVWAKNHSRKISTDVGRADLAQHQKEHPANDLGRPPSG